MEMNYGDFEGLHVHELRDRHKEFVTKWTANPVNMEMPNGESLTILQGRVWPVINDILNKNANALVVSHHFTIAAVLCKIRKIALSECRTGYVDIASRTIIECMDDRFHFEKFNDVG
jgi:alpha-ribazole phosphatase/probable phosphoglycerate mutase